MDSIIIRDLQIETLVGIFENERRKKQPVLINLELFCDLSKPGKTDNFKDALNYTDLEDKIIAAVENSNCFLLEKLAEMIAETALKFAAAKEVIVTLDKPNAPKYARSIAIKITRKKGGF